MKKTFPFGYIGSAIMLVIIAYLLISTILFINKNEVVKAKVVNVKFIEVSDSDSTDWYSLDLHILPSNKFINNYYFETGLIDPEFKVGQIFEMYYDESDPHNSEIKNFWVQWGPALLTFFIMIFYVLVTIAIMFFINKRKTISRTDMNISS